MSGLWFRLLGANLSIFDGPLRTLELLPRLEDNADSNVGRLRSEWWACVMSASLTA